MDTRSTPGRPLRPVCRAATTLLAAALTWIAGCQSGDGGRQSSTPMADPVSPSFDGTIDLEQRYVIGPEVARRMDYRIDWQTQTLPAGQTGLRFVSVQHDSLLVLDERNYLSRIRRQDGERLWRIPVANVWEEILGVNFMPDYDRVFLTTGGALLELDALTGSVVGRQQLDKVANTEPLRAGTFLIYGARNGQMIWHAFPVAYQWRAYQVSRSIRMKPLLYEEVVLAVGNDGRVMALDLGSASQLWNKRLLDAVVATPLAGNGAFYIAGMDQYVYCFDAVTGRTLWSRLTTSPLVDSPTLVENRLYQQIPGEGLTCFDAMPFDDPDGEIIWTARSVAGNVVTQRRDKLLAWHRDRRSLALVDQRGGGVVAVVDVPQVDGLLTTATMDGTLFAVSEDGRIERLVPRN